jgi:hypothetical protein
VAGADSVYTPTSTPAFSGSYWEASGFVAELGRYRLSRAPARSRKQRQARLQPIHMSTEVDTVIEAFYSRVRGS